MVLGDPREKVIQPPKEVRTRQDPQVENSASLERHPDWILGAVPRMPWLPDPLYREGLVWMEQVSLKA